MQLYVPAFPKLALALSIAGLLGGLAVSFVVTPRYVSSSEMQYAVANPDPGHPVRDLSEALMQNQQEVLSRTSLSRIIQDPRLDLYPSERTRIPLEDVIEKMRREDIQITRDNPGSPSHSYLAFKVSFAYRDRIKAQQTVQALITRLEEANIISQRISLRVKRQRSYGEVDRMEARIAALEKRLGMPPVPPEPLDQFAPVDAGLNLDVLDPPSLPLKPVYPNRFAFMFAGFGSGFAAAIVIAIFRRPMPPIPFPVQTA